jgi:spore germination cell wall hydrolase CwlJ-like protein
MSVTRKRPKGVRRYAPFGLSVLALSLMPKQIGYQDLVALMARQAEVPQRVRAHMLASPFGTIHAATFSFPQPVGTQIPDPPVQVASVGSYDPETTGTIGRDLSGGPMAIRRPPLDFPAVNRRLKGDLLVTRPHDNEAPPDGGSRDLTPGRVKTVTFSKPGEALPGDTDLKPDAAAKTEADVVTAARSPEADAPQADIPATVVTLASAPSTPAIRREQAALFDPIDDTNAAVRLGRLYFGNSPVGNVGTIESWPADEELVIEAPPAQDPDIKRSALAPFDADFNFETAGAAAAGAKPADPVAANETVAAKGEVTGAGKRPRTPAERLGLDGKPRAKAEKCLADAIYFESRGEPKRGQIAVAQVVMNRVFSGYYPSNVCGVVYQNANRKLACQFTFACDGIPDVVNEPDMWEQAKEIARDMMDGKLWLPEIGHSTHYHAYWVHPSWVNEMKKLYKIGVHSFYRPRNWGDGSEVPPLNQSQVQAPADADEATKAKL